MAENTHDSMLEKQAHMEEQISNISRRLDEQEKLTESVHKLALSLERLTMAQKKHRDKGRFSDGRRGRAEDQALEEVGQRHNRGNYGDHHRRAYIHLYSDWPEIRPER